MEEEEGGGGRRRREERWAGLREGSILHPCPGLRSLCLGPETREAQLTDRGHFFLPPQDGQPKDRAGAQTELFS
jgi:hypothetical protein